MIDFEYIKDYYPPVISESHAHYGNMMREYLQALILDHVICRTWHARNLSIVGGSCLRLALGFRRFAEALSFDYRGITKESFTAMVDSIVSMLRLNGLDMTAEIEEDVEGTYRATMLFHGLFRIMYQVHDDDTSLTLTVEARDYRHAYEHVARTVDRCGFRVNLPSPPFDILLSMKLSSIIKGARDSDMYDAVRLFQLTDPHYGYLGMTSGIHNSEELMKAIIEVIGTDVQHSGTSELRPQLYNTAEADNIAERFLATIEEQTKRLTKNRNRMNVIDLSRQYENVYVSGDTHGEYKTFLHDILVQRKIRDAAVIIAGDCGIGFNKPTYYDEYYKRSLAKKLRDANVTLLLVRGNHDDPRYFNEGLIDFPHMKSVPDYSIVHTTRHNILCVGGAVSVDRHPRISKMMLDRITGKDSLPIHWADEEFVYDDRALNSIHQSGIKIDTVVTHSAPDFCNPTDKRKIMGFLVVDETLSKDLKKEGEEIARLYRNLIRNRQPVRNWYFGHFHQSGTSVHESTTFHVLDINETSLIG